MEKQNLQFSPTDPESNSISAHLGINEERKIHLQNASELAWKASRDAGDALCASSAAAETPQEMALQWMLKGFAVVPSAVNAAHKQTSMSRRSR